MKPFISIVIPVYNNEKYLPKSIESVLNQTFENFEIIIVNDGSTDKTGNIADEFARKDERIKVIHQSNQWIYNSFNNGIAAANGEYVLVVNSDDTINKDSLKEINNICKLVKYDMVFFNLIVNKCDENQNILELDIGKGSSSIENNFLYIGKSEVRNNWINLMKKKLVHRQCVYKTSIAKKYRYRNDFYNADQLYNIQIADDINSIAGISYLVYNHFHYENIKMNASVGKYYGYEHTMFNIRHLEYIKLYKRWNIWNNEISMELADWRLIELSNEFKNLLAINCPLTTEEKLEKVFFESVDELIYSLSKENNKLDEMERRVIHWCRNILGESVLTKKSKVYFVYEMINIIDKNQKSGEDIKNLEKCIYDKNNKYNIGKYFYNLIIEELN